MNDQPLQSAQQIAEFFDADYRTILKLAKEGKIPYLRIGGNLRFHLPTLQKWIQEQEKKNAN